MYKYSDEISEVTLFACSQPIEGTIEGIENIQDLIAYCAKVSNPQFQTDFSKAEGLLKYLIKHKHWSPFEMVSATMEITTTRDIARQILRHRSFSFQEFSQRYADVSSMEDSFVLREARMQDPKNRQNSLDCDDRDLQDWWEEAQKEVIALVQQKYQQALVKKIAKEQARSILPEGNTVSRMYMQGSLRSWIHYCELRSANGTQAEHMLIAKECAKAIVSIFPMITDKMETEVISSKELAKLREDSELLKTISNSKYSGVKAGI
jgi:thymidylate synthase (FAD)